MQTHPTATLRRHQRHSQARAVILEAARELLLDAGIDGFTMRRLGERCGYTAPTIYHYFGDKQGLLDTLLEQVSASLLAELEQVEPAPDPLDTMRAHGIYPIARIVVTKDPLLGERRPEWAIKRRIDQRPWLDKSGRPWPDPHHDGPWQYAADLACG